MSDNYLQYVPVDSKFRPTAAAAEQARALLEAFVPEAEEVNIISEEQVRFFHPYGNWSGVRCPIFGEDAESWWKEAMSASYETGFTDLNVIAGCCGASVSLNDLNYVWPAAFGCFALEAMNPNVPDLTPSQKQQLMACLGCELRTVQGHV